MGNYTQAICFLYDKREKDAEYLAQHGFNVSKIMRCGIRTLRTRLETGNLPIYDKNKTLSAVVRLILSG